MMLSLFWWLVAAWFWWVVLRLLFREPDVCIGGVENPYLKRWYIMPRNPLFNIYLHQFLRDDDDRALHDHPWASISFVLRGKYMEFQPEMHIRRVGNIIFRRATHAHRIALFKRAEYRMDEKHVMHHLPAWTLFITGPKVREWGFHCPQGWRPWQVFCDPKDSTKIGRGCE